MDEATRLRMRRAHANHGHLCVCGRFVRGNGGQYQHRRACPKLARYNAFRDAGGKLTDLPTMYEFTWIRGTQFNPGRAAYECAQGSSDFLVWQPRDLRDSQGNQGYRVVRLPKDGA